jgi:hypothetical protein
MRIFQVSSIAVHGHSRRYRRAVGWLTWSSHNVILSMCFNSWDLIHWLQIPVIVASTVSIIASTLLLPDFFACVPIVQ